MSKSNGNTVTTFKSNTSVKNTVVPPKPEVKIETSDTDMPVTTTATPTTPVTNTEVKIDTLNIADINNIKDAMEFAELDSSYSKVVNIIADYNSSKVKGPAAKYNLYLQLVTLMNNVSHQDFVKNITMLNRLFVVERDNLLNVLNLVAEDYKWSYGAKSKIGFNTIVEMLSTLAKPETRAKKLKQVQVKNIFKYLNDAGVRNLTKYYRL